MMLGRHSAAGKTFIIAFFLALWIGEGSLLSASAMRLPQSPFKAEKKLGRWLKREPSVREKISRIIAQNPAAGSYAFPAALAEMGLKDALADIPAVEERRTGASRPRPMGCANFSECRLPPLELDTVSGEPLEPAIQAMLRPWLWLAEAVGRRLVLTPPQSGEGAQLLAMSLQDCGVGDVRLNVEARPGGGFRIWFDQGMALAEAYARQRGRETASY